MDIEALILYFSLKREYVEPNSEFQYNSMLNFNFNGVISLFLNITSNLHFLAN
jgi:hypothetical protein